MTRQVPWIRVSYLSFFCSLHPRWIISPIYIKKRGIRNPNPWYLSRHWLRLACKRLCLQNEQCNNLVIDYNLGTCRIYKGCQQRMITDKWPPTNGGLSALGLPNNHFHVQGGSYLKHPSPQYGKTQWNNYAIDWDHYRLECPARNNYL